MCVDLSDFVLVAGDSFIHWAQHWYDAQPDLGSTRRLEFIGGRGATPQSLKLMLARSWPKQHAPRHVVVHVGSNNLGRLSALCQREEIASLWEFLPCLSETTEFIWSDILPRASLNYTGDLTPERLRKVDLVRQEVNRFGRRLALRQGGRFIKHPSIQLKHSQLFRPDGIHLSEAGQACLIGDLLVGPIAFSPSAFDRAA